MKRLALAILVAGCSGHAAVRPITPVVPAVVTPPIAAAPQRILGRRPLAGEQLAAGRTNVYAGDILLGYLIRDPELFSAPHAAADTGISATVATDAGGTRYWRGVGDLSWCVAAAFGPDAPWTVVVP